MPLLQRKALDFVPAFATRHPCLTVQLAAGAAEQPQQHQLSLHEGAMRGANRAHVQDKHVHNRNRHLCKRAQRHPVPRGQQECNTDKLAMAAQLSSTHTPFPH